MTEPAAPPRAPLSATLIGFGAIVLWSALALLTALSGKRRPSNWRRSPSRSAALRPRLCGRARPAFALVQPWPVWAVGIGGLFGYHALYFAALRRAPPADASLIAYLWPLLIVLFSAALPGERLHPRHVIGAALGFAGAATLFLSKGVSFAAAGGPALRGYGLALCCAFVWSGYSVLSRRLKGAPTEAVAGFCLATAALAAVCHAAFETTVFRRPPPVARDPRPRPRAGRPRLLCLGLRRQARRHPLLGVAAYAAPVLSTLILVAAGVARDARARARLRADRRRGRRRLAGDVRRCWPSFST